MTEGESWYEISVEEELERERKKSFSHLTNNVFSSEPRRSFNMLSPLKEADRSLEMREEMMTDVSMEKKIHNPFTTPKKTRLGPRAALRHTSGESEAKISPARKVSVSVVEASPVSRNVHSRLGPRASSRHSGTPEQIGNKRNLSRDSPRESPMRDTDHKDKRHRMGTPTRERSRDTFFSTPEPIRNNRRSNRGKFKTPNSDSRLYTKKNSNKSHLSGANKDLFGNTRSRGNSESCKENEEPLKSLSEEQIAKREKQVMYGKVTEGYQNYKSIIPKNMRDIRDPTTPKKDYPYSKRCWDGLVRSWRRKLHEWDNPTTALANRAAYTKNNQDLKDCGLVDEAGELVMFTQAESTESVSTSYQTREETASSLEQDPDNNLISAISWDIPQFKYPEDDDDARSQDSEYTRLLGNTEDFPEEDESDTEYRLSQDLAVQSDDDMECEEMNFEEEAAVLLGEIESVSQSVC